MPDSFTTCPRCGAEQPEGYSECLHCGIIFGKYRRPDEHDISLAEHAELPFDSIPNPISLAGRALLLMLLTVCGVQIMVASPPTDCLAGSFLHLVNLPFHEAGHIFFRPLGRFMTSLGGSLGQLIMPLVCMTVLIVKTRDPFGGAAAFWWFGENFLDLAPYINDANRLVLPLLGGNTGETAPYGFHDWEYILTETGLVGHSQALARASSLLGDAVMISALAWAAYVLYTQYLAMKRAGARPGI